MPGGQVCVTQAKSNYCLFIWREWFSNCFYGSKQWVSWLLQELHLWSLAQPTHNWTGGIFCAFCIIHQLWDSPKRWCLFQFNQMKYPWFCQEWMWSCLLPSENIAPWREFVVSSLWPNSSVPSPGLFCAAQAGDRRAARAPLINTSDHVLQIQCHFQFPNCPRGQPSTSTPGLMFNMSTWF